MNRPALTLICLAALTTSLTACRSTTPDGEIADRVRAMELLIPGEIAIVAPFTRLKSFGDDGDNGEPDGIELLLEARNAMDNPGLMIAGQVRVELFAYVPASANQKGRRLEQWHIELRTEKQQKSHWNGLTQMYEFKLGVDTSRIPKADRYVLRVTYRSPFGTHLTDELVLTPRAAAAPP